MDVFCFEKQLGLTNFKKGQILNFKFKTKQVSTFKDSINRIFKAKDCVDI